MSSIKTTETTKTICTECGKLVRLDYLMTCHNITIEDYGEVLVYGIKVIMFSEEDNDQETVEITDISCDMNYVKKLIDILSYGDVTPTTVCDIIEDYLSA